MVDTKRILILTADAGFGHRSAANAIAAALQETHGDECTIEIANPLEDGRVPGFLRRSQTDYDRIVREMPDLYRFGYEASDASVPSWVIESALTVMLFEVMRDRVRQYQPDTIVTTYPLYQAPLGAVYAFGRHQIPLLTVVTDLATVHRLWFHDAADLCLVPTQHVRDLALEFHLAPQNVQITGIPVHPDVARETRGRAALRVELGWEVEPTTVLAVGSKRVENFDDVLRGLNHSGLPLQLVVVAGGDDELHQRLLSTEWHLPTRVHNFVTNMPTIMHAADCIICKAGGLIVTESLACGLPLLLMDVLPGQEAGNAQYVIEGGAGDLVESPIAALETVYHWLDSDGRLMAERAVNARRLGRPLAAYEIAERAFASARSGVHTRADRHARARPKLMALFRRYGVSWKDRSI